MSFNNWGVNDTTRLRVFRRDKYTCQYCGQSGCDAELEVDHIHPRSKGGSDGMGNLITACHACNVSKGASTDWVAPNGREPKGFFGGPELSEWTCSQQHAEVRRISQDDVDFVSALLSDERIRKEAKEALDGLALPEGPLAELVRALFESTGMQFETRLESEEARALYAAVANNPDIDAQKTGEVVRHRLGRLKRDALKTEQTEVMREIREAERAGDSPLVVVLMRRKADISTKLDSIAAAQM